MSWEEVELGSVVHFSGGSQPAKKYFEYESNDKNIRLLQIRDYKSDKNITYVPKVLAKKFCLKTDIMIGRYGPPVFQILSGLEGAYNVALMKAIPSEKIVPQYLWWTLKRNDLFQLIDGLSRRTAGQSGVDMDALRAFKIPLPPLPIQKKIAEALEKADKLRQLRQEQLNKLDELLQSTFLDMFGDPVSNPKGFKSVNLSEICKVSQGLQIPIKSRFSEPLPSRKLYLTIAYINGKKTAEYIENPRESVVVNSNEILVCRTGNTGKIFTGLSGVFHNNFFKVVWDESLISKEYFYSFLSHKKTYADMLSRASTTTIPDLNHDQFYQIKILIPDILTQQKWKSFKEKHDNSAESIEFDLRKSINLFNSLMQKAFKGELEFK